MEWPAHPPLEGGGGVSHNPYHHMIIIFYFFLFYIITYNIFKSNINLKRKRSKIISFKNLKL